ncbi:MAG: sugar phosphate isomerase/epimerase family protein [Acetivibrionales bacterium]
MLANNEDEIGSRYISCLKDFGYDYVELPLAQVMALSEEEFHLLLDRIEKTGIQCECCNNFFPASIRLTGPNVDAMVVRNYVHRALERASQLGAKTIVFGSSGARNVPQGFSHEQAFQQLVELLQQTISYEAEKKNIEIVIEPLNRHESNIIQTLEEGELLMERVARTNVALLVDYYHFYLEEEPLSVLSRCVSRIRHVHFAEPKGREIPTVPREEYEVFFSALQRGGYSGRISVEGYAQATKDALQKAIFLKKYWD